MLGAVLRTVYLVWSAELPFFDYPITDALYHHRWAEAIAQGVLWDGQPFFRAPGYPYLLGLQSHLAEEIDRGADHLGVRPATRT